MFTQPPIGTVGYSEDEVIGHKNFLSLLGVIGNNLGCPCMEGESNVIMNPRLKTQ